MTDKCNFDASTTDLSRMTESIALSEEKEMQPIEDDEVEEDPTVCEICLDGECYDENEIIFCDKCNVAVHQHCYNVPTIPEGEWYCYPCSVGLNPSTLACELCSNMGGAYKVTERGKWSHPLCSSWVPEIYETTLSHNKMPVLNLTNLDKKRYKLKCALCTTKGACIQCSYGRCTTAAHPWCVLKKSQGFTRRIVKNEEGHMIWEIFCKAHAKAVSEPLKPKPKSKTSVFIQQPEEEVLEILSPAVEKFESTAYLEDKYINSSSKKYKKDYDNNGQRRLTMSHAKQYGNSNFLIYGDAALQSTGNNTVRSPRLSAKDSAEFDDLIDNESSTSLRNDGQTSSGGKSNSNSNKRGVHNSIRCPPPPPSSATFPILNLAEWPGQNEGEAMDLEHYWNVISSYFPEDHSAQWLDFMTSSFLEHQGHYDNEEENLLGMSELGASTDKATMEDLEDQYEDKIALLGGEREKTTLFDMDRRNTFLVQVEGRLDQLRGKNGGGEHTNLHVLDENAFYTRQIGPSSAAGIKQDCGRDDDNLSTLSVVFDGNTRVGCDFKVDFPVGTAKSSSKIKDTVAISLTPTDASIQDKWVSENLLPSRGHPQEDFSLRNGLTKLKIESDDALVRLDDFRTIQESAPVYLPDRSIIPRDEDNILCRALRTDQQAYKELMETLRQQTTSLFNSHLVTSDAFRYAEHSVEWTTVNEKYQKQQVWKCVCSSIYRGIRDQRPDFNRVEAEAVPASWAIKVDGRPPMQQEEAEEPEVHEDAVCMCCFDGKSYENNPILFCDGCNATLHQSCYGVAEVPEGDFFCDRCRYIQIRAADPNDVDWHYNDGDLKAAVMCCLCPLFHGGFKPTTDGRWVHLCCAFLSNAAVITDLTQMGPVDVSAIPVQEPVDESENRRNRKSLSSVSATSLNVQSSSSSSFNLATAACLYCNVQGGFVVQCSHHNTSESCDRCTAVFHPICAWFDGAAMCSDITDSTFQGLESDGRYPSGLTFAFYCDDHASSLNIRPSPEIKADQKALRCKYRIREEDLEEIPERNRRKRKKPKQKKQGGGGRMTAANTQVLKDLNPDTYDDTTCAICLEPTTEDVFGCGFDPATLAAIGIPPEGNPTLGELNISTNFKSEVNTEFSITNNELNASVEPGSSDVVVTIEGQDNQVRPMETVSTLNQVVAEWSSTPLSPIPTIRQQASTSPLKVSHAKSAAITDRSVVLKCRQCSITVHKCCFVTCLPCGVDSTLSGVTDFLCDTCELINPEERDVRCVLCPRRGGFLKRTNENTWVHVYCGTRTTNQGFIQSDGLLDVRNVSKDNRKIKCAVCNRKGGFAVRCNALGCTSHFHPICGVRSGRAWFRSRQGVRQVYCVDHLPEGVERLASGYWVDGYEVSRFRYCLDRARLILDILLRREKYKKLLCKAELEWFLSRYNRIVDKATGKRGHRGQEEGVSTGLTDDDMTVSEYESEDESLGEEEDEVDMYGAVKDNNADVKRGRPPKGSKSDDFEPIVSLQYGPADKEVRVELMNEETELISATWTKRGEIRLPKRVTATFAGVDVRSKDTQNYGGIKAFTREMKDKLVKNTDVHRASTQLFVSQKEETDFAKKLGPALLRHMHLDNETFTKEMEKSGLKVTFTVKKAVSKSAATTPSGKKIKKGYVILDDEISEPPHTARSSAASSAAISMAIAASTKKGKKSAVEIFEAPSTSKKDGKQRAARFEEIEQSPLRPSTTKKGRKLSIVNLAESDDDDEVVDVTTPQPKKRGRKSKNHQPEEVDDVVGGLLSHFPKSSQKKAKLSEEALERAFEEEQRVVALKEKQKEKQQKKESEKLVLVIPSSSVKGKKRKSSDVEDNVEIVSSPVKGKKAKVKQMDESQQQHNIVSSPAVVKRKGINLGLVNTQRLYPHVVSMFRTRPQLEKLIEQDSIASDLVTKFPCLRGGAQQQATIAQGGFEMFFGMFEQQVKHQLESHLNSSGKQEDLLSDWHVFDAKEVSRLERRIQDILSAVEEAKVPDVDVIKPLAKKASSSKKKSVTRLEEEEEDTEMRELAAEFSEVPYDLIPNYNDHVRKVLTMESLRNSWTAHEYRSMAEFSHDFYTLMNNARSVTVQTSLIWDDSAQLVEIFEQAKLQSLTSSSCSKAKVAGKEIVVESVSNSSRNGKHTDAVTQLCGICTTEYRISNWPVDFARDELLLSAGENSPQDTTTKTTDSQQEFARRLVNSKQLSGSTPETVATSSRKSSASTTMSASGDVDRALPHSWSWICPSCVHECGPSLIGKEIQVWWHDDSLAYRGVVNAYDEVSGTHRVLYQDQEWEFISLAVEPCVLNFAPISEITEVDDNREETKNVSRTPHRKNKSPVTTSISSKKKAMADDAELAMTESEDETIVVSGESSSGLKKYATNGWAVAQLATAATNDFQFPSDYVLNTRHGLEKRKNIELKFRAQWKDAVDALANSNTTATSSTPRSARSSPRSKSPALSVPVTPLTVSIPEVSVSTGKGSKNSSGVQSTTAASSSLVGTVSTIDSVESTALSSASKSTRSSQRATQQDALTVDVPSTVSKKKRLHDPATPNSAVLTATPPSARTRRNN